MRVPLAALVFALFPTQSLAQSCLTGDCNRTGGGFALCAMALEKLPTSDACVVGHAAYFTAYVDGVFDALIARKLVCPGPETVRNHGRIAVKAYLQQNPEQWNLHVYDLTRDALLEAFPCDADSTSR